MALRARDSVEQPGQTSGHAQFGCDNHNGIHAADLQRCPGNEPVEGQKIAAERRNDDGLTQDENERHRRGGSGQRQDRKR
jgi:hypothetical protein